MAQLLTCYNRGCGQKFDPCNNTEDSCTHHPGVPFFHDAYKGWTCCNKKSVDFTEFLNIKGCTKAKHSNEKPPEPEKPVKEEIVIDEPVPEKLPEPIRKPTLQRPSWDTPLCEIEPVVAPALKKQIDELPVNVATKKVSTDPSHIPGDTVCKNNGCSYTYKSYEADHDTKPCVYHPGVPIFHEGMKFWSCCQRKTSDFTAFMNQAGCETGTHKWASDEDVSKAIKCRLDWHQTATNVVITIYAKMYHYQKSVVKLNPIRMYASLVFPEQNNNEYTIDMELRGVVDVPKCKVQMFGSKVEVTLVKAEPGSWPKLDFPREKKPSLEEVKKRLAEEQTKALAGNDSDSDVDLDDIEPLCTQATLTEIK